MIIKLNNQTTSEPTVAPSFEDTESLKQETMESLSGYVSNLADKMSAMITELREDIKEDSWEYLRMMVDGFNWVLEAYNALSDTLNPDGANFDNKAFDTTIAEFGKAFCSKNIDSVTGYLESDIVPFLRKLDTVVTEKLS